MFWPSVEEIRRQKWGKYAWVPDGPSRADVVITLLPALRAMFMLGHHVLRVHFSDEQGSGATTEWQTLDLVTGETYSELLPFDRPYSGFNVAFTLRSITDPSLPTDESYAMKLPIDVLGGNGTSAGDDSAMRGLEEVVTDFVEVAISNLSPVFGAGTAPPRKIGGGLLWILDPTHWRGLTDPLATNLFSRLLSRVQLDAESFLTGQFWSTKTAHGATESGRPSLFWLAESYYLGSMWSSLSGYLYDSLQERGLAHALPHAVWETLNSTNGPCWLDVLTQLLGRGVILIDGLIEPCDPVPPIEAIQVTEKKVELIVWGETCITLTRVRDIDGKTGITGSASWEYIVGDAHSPATLLLVVGRGIKVEHEKLRRWSRWKLELHRVQDDGLIGANGAVTDPSRYLGANLIEPHAVEYDDYAIEGQVLGGFPKLMTRYKPDGLYLEYPIFGSALPPPDDWIVRDQAYIPLSIDLTFDPYSGDEGYAIDVQYYTYYFEGTWGPLGGAHVTIWATNAVTILSSGASREVEGSGSTQNGIEKTLYSTGFRITAEVWRVDDLTSLPRPWSKQLPITESLTRDPARILSDVPRLSDTSGSNTAVHNGVKLTRADWSYTQFKYYDSLFMDAIDLAIGFVPVVGDVVDVAETVYAWRTGRDKWGRPVTDFELTFMTIGCAPIVSSSFTKLVADWVTSRPDRLLQSGELVKLFNFAQTAVTPNGILVNDALATSRTWQLNSTMGTGAKQALVDDLVDFLAKNPNVISTYVSKITAASGDSWLTLSDIYDKSSKTFRLATINDGWQRWLIRNNGKDPEEFLRSGARGKARAMAEALLGSSSVGVRRSAARRVIYPSEEGRAFLIGKGVKRLSDIKGRDLLDAVEVAAAEALNNSGSMMIVHAGPIVPAADAVAFTANAIRSDMEKLLVHVAGSVESATGDVLKSIVGGDLLNGNKVSLEERGYRAAKALVMAREEAARIGRDPDALADGDMVDALRDFVKTFVSRSGYEWGGRFESRVAMDLHQTLGDAASIRTQLSMPNTAGNSLLSGPDHVVYGDSLAIAVEGKAFRSLDNLVGGDVSFVEDSAGAVLSVEGPSLPAQLIRGAIRSKHWNGWVPRPGVEPTLTLPADPTAAGWQELGNTRVAVVDDLYLCDVLYRVLSEALGRTGKTVIHFDNDVRASDEVKALLKAVFSDDTVDFGDPELDVIEELAAYMQVWRVKTQDEINNAFKQSAITKRTGTGFKCMLLLASDEPEHWVNSLLALLEGG